MQVRMLRVPNHPYASYGTVPRPDGGQWIFFACSMCRDRSQYPCSRPDGVGVRVMTYAHLHAHGLVARRRA